MNILNLINRSLEVPVTIKNTNKIFLFLGMNATSETLLQNLLFRLENHAPQSNVYIKQTELDSVDNNDSMYSWYQDSEETSKAFQTALKFSGAFKTPVSVLPNQAKSLFIENENSSLIIIDTEGAINDYSNNFDFSNYLGSFVSFDNHPPKDVMIMQGYMTSNDEYLAIKKSNPDSINYKSLIGSDIEMFVKQDCYNHMQNNLFNEYDRAYMLASKMMNVLNNYITENMKLDYSKAVTNLDTLETTYEYFNKDVDYFAEFSLGDEYYTEDFKTTINNLVKQSLATVSKDMLENPQMYADMNVTKSLDLFRFIFYSRDAVSNTSGAEAVLTYQYRGTDRPHQANILKVYNVIIRMMSVVYTDDNYERRRISESNIILYSIAFYEIISKILGGSFQW